MYGAASNSRLYSNPGNHDRTSSLTTSSKREATRTTLVLLRGPFLPHVNLTPHSQMIPILMTHHKLSLQEAVDYVGDLCKQTIDGFIENEKLIPSWGEEVDKEVAIYVKGLRDWIVGSLHWSFMTERYFGTTGSHVKEGRVVKLLPKKQRTA